MNKKVGKAFRVRINSILPGLIQTDMGDQTFVSRARNHRTNDVDAAPQLALSGHPIGRLGVPDTTDVETNRSP
jgi:NAD(P)-dependent dehydrogenase (short-subunit alcohol dehydrogenase family)